MRSTCLSIIVLVSSGCAGRQVAREGDTVPYKAIVVFHWNDGGERPAEGSGGGPDEGPAGAPAAPSGVANAFPEHQGAGERRLTRLEVEDAILDGIEEYQVFSDFKATDPEAAREVAAREKADIIVKVQLGELARWDEGSSQVVPGLAILDILLWAGTGIGSWWIGDQEYPTLSEVEVAWKRTESPPRKGPGPELKDGFKTRERISGRQYRLSFWERSKPWRTPLPYLLSIIVPPPFVPLKDPQEVGRSLQVSALADLKRELARKLKGGSIGAGGAPFLFSLERPLNGAAVEGRRAEIVYRYRVEPGFEEHEATRLGSLAVFVKPQDEERYVLRRSYSGDSLRTINEKIAADGEIKEEIEGLGPGLNLIRFVARAEYDKQLITNTVAILCR